jgi:regulator of protease activity HflC (stomatin/prohibitin superfamily)
MTNSHESQAGQISVDQAMNLVLAAERDARLAVDECRAEAARIIAHAETRARALSGRSEARIKAAHRIANAAIARALADLVEVPAGVELDEPVEGAPHDVAAIPEALAKAVETLAGEILGAGSS